MPSPLSTIVRIPIYATFADLDADNQDEEVGNLAVAIDPGPTLYMWDGTVWQPITSTTSIDLSVRVTKLESRLACLADCLTQETP